MTKTTTLLAVGALCSAMGCAHAPAPTDQLASAIAAVRAAEEAGAEQVPEAALHVKLAEEQIQQAEKLMSDDKNDKAQDKVLRARNDAELALSLTHQRSAKTQLTDFESAHSSAGGEQAPMQKPATEQPTMENGGAQ